MDTENRILIIDNGSYECRVGWNHQSVPELRFRNVLMKPRKDRKKDLNAASTGGVANTIPSNVQENASEIQVGNDIQNIEAVRAHLKSPFERNVVTNWNNQEQIFDYVFSKFGFDGDDNIAHPIILTEPLANPNVCRQQMNELLFECYGVPALTSGIDALFSWHRYQKQSSPISDGLIISFGFTTTHVIPMLNGKLHMENVRRLNVGGYHITNYLFRLMQMKYPVHLNSITISRMEKIIHSHCHISKDYKNEIPKWTELDYYDAHIMKIQLPYNPTIPSNTLKTAEQKLEKRREMALRLINSKNMRDQEQLKEDKHKLVLLKQLRELHSQNQEQFESALNEQQISSIEELDSLISTVTERIARTVNRANSSPQRNRKIKKKIAKPPDGVPQHEWLRNLREKCDELLRRKQVRQQQRQEQAKRHTHAAQQRMRLISSLARSEKRNIHGAIEDDDFGRNDNDWDVYKQINRYNEDSDSDAEAEEMLEYQKIINYYDSSNNSTGATQPLTSAEDYQLHFGLEAIRVPEIFFQPSMIGCPESGLAELIDFVLKLFTPAEQQRIVNNVYLTGGCANFKGLKDRLERELRELRPFESNFSIYESDEHTLGAWLGASQQACESNITEILTTRKIYEEFGSEYFVEHKTSNLYYPTVQKDPI